MKLTQEYLKSRVNYNPYTGVFTWISRIKYSNIKIGSSIGSIDSHGYLATTICNKFYRLHRLAWLYMTGNFPENEIDHINGIKTDNS